MKDESKQLRAALGDARALLVTLSDGGDISASLASLVRQKVAEFDKVLDACPGLPDAQPTPPADGGWRKCGDRERVEGAGKLAETLDRRAWFYRVTDEKGEAHDTAEMAAAMHYWHANGCPVREPQP